MRLWRQTLSHVSSLNCQVHLARSPLDSNMLCAKKGIKILNPSSVERSIFRAEGSKWQKDRFRVEGLGLGKPLGTITRVAIVVRPVVLADHRPQIHSGPGAAPSQKTGT